MANTALGSDSNAAAGTPPEGSANAGNQVDQWLTSLPEDIRGEKVFESYKGKPVTEALPLIAKSLVHAQRMVGADKLVLPTEKSTPEEIRAFHQKLGVPEKHTDYKYKLPDGITEKDIDAKRIDVWREKLHKANVPASTAERLLDEVIGESFAMEAEITKRTEQWGNSLKQVFGDKYDSEVNFARLALSQLGDEAKELKTLLSETGLGNHPALVKLLSNYGKTLQQDSNSGGRGNGTFTGTPEQALAELAAFSKNPENIKALFDAKHPRHADVVSERKKLFELAYPPEKS